MALLLAMFGGFAAAVADSRRRSRGAQAGGWTTGPAVARSWTPLELARQAPGPRTTPVVAAPPAGRRALDAIRKTDPDFSTAIFEDFLYSLFTEAHVAAGAGRLDKLAPYLRTNVREDLAKRTNGEVRFVIVGAMRVEVSGTSETGRHRVDVVFEANYAIAGSAGGETAYWTTERWRLSRSTSARSRPPARARILDCPNCGAALDKIIGSECKYCNRVVDTGDFDWVVERIDVLNLEPRGPMLESTTEEVGTDFPTVVDPSVRTNYAGLAAKDPKFDYVAFQSRVALVFATMQTAWSSLEWERARPFLTDNLFESLRYWIESYKRAGWRNVTAPARILRIDLARVSTDRWFDSLTIRVFATGFDYTVDDSDQSVVSGSKTRERTYSEYWTLIRGASVSARPQTEAMCPACGAPLAVSMAGACTHCHAKVNAGEFDWVLARIEQDDVYSSSS